MNLNPNYRISRIRGIIIEDITLYAQFNNLISYIWNNWPHISRRAKGKRGMGFKPFLNFAFPLKIQALKNVFHLWTKEWNKLTVKSINAIIQVHYNYKNLTA